jgi:hypothetical protein
MFGTIVKDLYIGKSKLTIECNQKEIPQTTLVQDILQNTGFTGNMPDYGTYGNFKDGKFEITPMMPKHCLFITGVPKGAILDNFRVRRTYWSSYYEDDVRGYLFQITDESIPRLIITN